MNSLRNRFVELWIRNSVVESSNALGSDQANRVFDQLHELYCEDWRKYHNLNHIETLLAGLDEARDFAESPDAIEFAIWFHDCIYDLNRNDNEACSANWFMEISQNHITEKIRNTVSKLIMDTCHHETPNSQDGKLLADIDLISFGLSWDHFVNDGKALDLEQAYFGKKTTDSQKLAFLQRLLAGGHFYFTDFYRDKYRENALKNINKQIQILSDRDLKTN